MFLEYENRGLKVNFSFFRHPSIATLAECIPNDARLIELLNKSCDTMEPFMFSIYVLEDNLNQIVKWAKVAPYFDHLEVSVIPFTSLSCPTLPRFLLIVSVLSL